jgi:predicted neuraminidase
VQQVNKPPSWPSLAGLGWFLLCLGMMTPHPVHSATLSAQPGYVRAAFIYEEAPFPECHASTIEQATDHTLIAAWFGGTRERHPDVGIWVARLEDEHWTEPVEVANGLQADGSRYPTWNPVLFQAPAGPLLLFFKTGPSPSTWWGERMVSDDHGRTWRDRERLPEGILGPVRNKPVLLGNLLLCGSSTEQHGWVVHMEATRDLGRSWEKTGPLNVREEFAAIQPTILKWGDRRVQLLHRTQQSVVTENWMEDDWQSWSPMRATSIPNPNSGIDGLVLRDGRGLLVYNHIGKAPNRWGGRRSPLNVAVSSDGMEWEAALVLEHDNGEYSYPAVIQAHDGLVHITYTWKRQRIRHVVIDPARLRLVPMESGAWPESKTIRLEGEPG